MIKISKLADYATVLMSALAERAPLHCSASTLSEVSHIALPTVSKVLKLLNEAGLIRSVRGASGGYQLVKSPVDISVVEIIAAIDGEPALTECSHGAGSCVVDQVCGLRGSWQRINRLVLNVLEQVTLADMNQTDALHEVVLTDRRKKPMDQNTFSAGIGYRGKNQHEC